MPDAPVRRAPFGLRARSTPGRAAGPPELGLAWAGPLAVPTGALVDGAPGTARLPGAPALTTSATEPAPPPRSRSADLAAVAVGVVVAAGIVARFVARSHLWLDEALTVDIARLPLHRIPVALGHDGSPPLYYFLLHGWMRLFGTGTIAVRAFSGLCSVACLPLMWAAARRIGGRRAAAVALVVLSTAPYAVQYATEARMYSLVMVLVLVGGLALAAMLERPTWRSGALLAGDVAALLWTHYYGAFVVGVAGLVVLGRALCGRERERRRAARLAAAALVVGGLLFLPWLPVFLYQRAHTGAPWGVPGAGLGTVLDSLAVLVNGYRNSGPFPVLVFESLIALAVFGRTRGRRRIEIDLLGREPHRTIAAVTFGALTLGVLASGFSGQAFAPRYAAIAYPGVILLAALGADGLADRRLRLGAVVLVGVFGVLGTVPVMRFERTQAPEIARRLRRQAQPGDVIVYCPDQLGPSVSRLLPDRLDQLTFPRGDAPQLVNWVDYTATIRGASVTSFARMLVARAGDGHSVWFVGSRDYRIVGPVCGRLEDALADLRFEQPIVPVRYRLPEHLGLIRFPG